MLTIEQCEQYQKWGLKLDSPPYYITRSCNIDGVTAIMRGVKVDWKIVGFGPFVGISIPNIDNQLDFLRKKCHSVFLNHFVGIEIFYVDTNREYEISLCLSDDIIRFCDIKVNSNNVFMQTIRHEDLDQAIYLLTEMLIQNQGIITCC